jgi:hypothetical protein
MDPKVVAALLASNGWLGDQTTGPLPPPPVPERSDLRSERTEEDAADVTMPVPAAEAARAEEVSQAPTTARAKDDILEILNAWHQNIAQEVSVLQKQDRPAATAATAALLSSPATPPRTTLERLPCFGLQPGAADKARNGLGGRQVVFLRIPKNGSTSVMKLLQHAEKPASHEPGCCHRWTQRSVRPLPRRQGCRAP